MSKRETPLTRRFWEERRGTLIEEFCAVRRADGRGPRMLDGVLVLGAPHRIARASDVEIANQDIIVIQTKAGRLGMYLLGQALFSRELMLPFLPKSIKTVAICEIGDTILEPLATKHGIEVVVYGPSAERSLLP